MALLRLERVSWASKLLCNFVLYGDLRILCTLKTVSSKVTLGFCAHLQLSPLPGRCVVMPHTLSKHRALCRSSLYLLCFLSLAGFFASCGFCKLYIGWNCYKKISKHTYCIYHTWESPTVLSGKAIWWFSFYMYFQSTKVTKIQCVGHKDKWVKAIKNIHHKRH